MGTNYEELKKYTMGNVRGLTKKLGKTFYGQGPQRPRLAEALVETGLGFGGSADTVDGELFLFHTEKKITVEQTAIGKSWLKEYFFKKDGSPRSGKRTEGVSQSVLLIAKSVSRFEFIGVLGLRNVMGDLCHFLPIYRTYDRKGNYFDYAPGHWAAPIILDEMFTNDNGGE